MAINRGVLGTQTGSMGGITASNWKGRNVYKQKVPATNTSNTEAQRTQRAKFTTLTRASRLIGGAIRVGFRDAAATITEQNVFISKNKDVLLQSGDNYKMILAKVVVSSGTVATLANLTSSYVVGTRVLTLNWDDNSNGQDALPDDQVCVALVDDFANAGEAQLFIATRQDSTVQVTVPPLFAAQVGQKAAFIFLKRMNGTGTSPSQIVPAQ